MASLAVSRGSKCDSMSLTIRAVGGGGLLAASAGALGFGILEEEPKEARMGSSRISTKRILME